MGCVCTKTRHLHDQLDLEVAAEDSTVNGNGNNGASVAHLVDALKRQRSARLVGVQQVSVTPELRATEEFATARRTKHNRLSYHEYKRILFRLNYPPSKRKLRKHEFHQVDQDGDGEISEREFARCFSLLDRRDEMRLLFDQAIALGNHPSTRTTATSATAPGGDAVITPQQLFEFFLLTAPPDEPSGWTPPNLKECREDLFHGKATMTYFEFRSLLSDSANNHVCAPRKLFTVYQDMTRPLSHYYINSSHNTYLEGNQTNSNSTPLAIKRALRLGVRVIELDVWDGKTGPIVNHGHTMCRPTSFELCVRAVAETAFVASPFPVILTIENHCTRAHQERMASILHDVLGDKLFKFHRREEESGMLVEDDLLLRGPLEWASPAQLQNKVIIRDKPKALHVRKTGVEPRRKMQRGNKLVLKESEEEEQEQEDGGRDQNLSLPVVDETTSADRRASAPVTNTRVRGASMELIKGFVQAASATSPVHLLSSSSSHHQQYSQPLKTTKRKITTTTTTTLNDDDEDDEDDDEDEELHRLFLDDAVENEGLADSAAARLQKTRQDVVKKLGQIAVASSFRSAGGAGSSRAFPFGSSASPLSSPSIAEDSTAAASPEKTTNSVPQLLEITYIKNVKMRVKEDAVRRRTSMRPAPGASSLSNSTNLSTSASASSSSLAAAASTVTAAAAAAAAEFALIHYTYPPWRSSSSVAEGRMLKLVKPGPRSAALSTYALEHLIRCYPAGTRVESTNYDPCPAWNAGIQVVALNFQTNGRSMWLNQGKFTDNNASGYVLKPAKMLAQRPCGKDSAPAAAGSSSQFWDLSFNPHEERADRLTITVLSAHWLPKPLGADAQRSEIIDPFVELSIAGYEADSTSVEKTKFVRNNGFDPQFGEVFEFVLRKSELDLLLLVVKDKDTYGEDFIGQNCFPVNLMRPGYRVVPLKRADGTPLPDAFVFVRVEWERESVVVAGSDKNLNGGGGVRRATSHSQGALTNASSNALLMAASGNN